MNNPVVPKLLEAVEEINKTTGSCFSLDMYWEAQLEKTVRELEVKHKNELEEKNRKIKELEGNISGTALGNVEEDQSPGIVRIVLVGKTGSGKSATGNTILQKKEFESKPSSKSVTTRCQKGVGDVAGRRITVVDTPGLFDTSVNNEQVQQEIARCISFLAPGPHVFLLVLQIGRFTQEEKETLQLIKETFGKMAEMFTIVLFTRGDELNKESIESYIQRSDRTIQNLIHDCGNRFHVFNNKDQSDITQVTELLEKIDMMVQKNGGGCYTNEMFQEAERTIKKECERIMREKEGEIQREKVKLKAIHEEEMEEMKRRIEEQRHKIEEERARQETELKEREQNLKKEIEARKKREKESSNTRDEDKKRGKCQEFEGESKTDEMDFRKVRVKKESQCRKDEDKKRVKIEKKQHQELIKIQTKGKGEFEEKLTAEKKNDTEEQERRSQDEIERKEREQKTAEAEKEKKEISQDVRKRAEEWELQRREKQKHREEAEIERKQREYQRRREWAKKQLKMTEKFETKIEPEKQRINEKREKEKIENDLEEEKGQLEEQQKRGEKERSKEEVNREREDQRREEGRQKLLEKLLKEQEVCLQTGKENEAWKEVERKRLQAVEEDHKRKINEMEQKFKDDARKQAEECNGFVAEFLKLDLRKRDLPVLKKMREVLKDGNNESLVKSLDEKVKQIEEKGCSVM